MVLHPKHRIGGRNFGINGNATRRNVQRAHAGQRRVGGHTTRSDAHNAVIGILIADGVAMGGAARSDNFGTTLNHIAQRQTTARNRHGSAVDDGIPVAFFSDNTE